MATTRRTRPDPAVRRLDIPAAAACVAALLSGAAQAQAQTKGVEFGLGSELSWTSNATLGAAGGPDDTILTLRPRMRLFSDGARVKLSGSAELAGVAYADKTQPNRVDPTADLSARVEAIERLFFVELGYRAAQTSQNVFGVRPDATGTNNQITASQWRFSPWIEGRAAADLRYQLRSDNTWTRQLGGQQGAAAVTPAGRFSRLSALVSKEPTPIGWRLDADRSQTRYDDGTPSLTTELVRLSLDYALTSDWTAGVRTGSERNDIATDEQRRHTLFGFQTRWEPSPRTLLTAYRETRTFATAWDLAFTHRHPLYAWNLSLTRGVNSAPQELFDLPATNNVAGLLDAMLTTRITDPIARAVAVQQEMAQRSLSNALAQPVTLFAERFSLVTARRLSLSLLGKRNTLTLSGFSSRAQDVLDAGAFSGGSSQINNVQKGAGLQFSHTISAQMSLGMGLDWSRIRGLGASAGDESTQESANMQVSFQLSPKSTAVVGGRYRRLDSTVATDGKEGVAFVGFDHRF